MEYLQELSSLLKKVPHVVEYIADEFERPDLLGFVCLEDICLQNYHTTGDLISELSFAGHLAGLDTTMPLALRGNQPVAPAYLQFDQCQF